MDAITLKNTNLYKQITLKSWMKNDPIIRNYIDASNQPINEDTLKALYDASSSIKMSGMMMSVGKVMFKKVAKVLIDKFEKMGVPLSILDPDGIDHHLDEEEILYLIDNQLDKQNAGKVKKSKSIYTLMISKMFSQMLKINIKKIGELLNSKDLDKFDDLLEKIDFGQLNEDNFDENKKIEIEKSITRLVDDDGDGEADKENVVDTSDANDKRSDRRKRSVSETSSVNSNDDCAIPTNVSEQELAMNMNRNEEEETYIEDNIIYSGKDAMMIEIEKELDEMNKENDNILAHTSPQSSSMHHDAPVVEREPEKVEDNMSVKDFDWFNSQDTTLVNLNKNNKIEPQTTTASNVEVSDTIVNKKNKARNTKVTKRKHTKGKSSTALSKITNTTDVKSKSTKSDKIIEKKMDSMEVSMKDDKKLEYDLLFKNDDEVFNSNYNLNVEGGRDDTVAHDVDVNATTDRVNSIDKKNIELPKISPMIDNLYNSS